MKKAIILGIVLIALGAVWFMFMGHDSATTDTQDTASLPVNTETPTPSENPYVATEYTCDPEGTLVVSRRSGADNEVLSIDFNLAADGLRETLPRRASTTNEYEGFGAVVIDNDSEVTVSYADTTYTCAQ